VKKIVIGLILGFVISSIASAIAVELVRKYRCDDAVWTGPSTLEVHPANGAPFVGELGFCPDGLVLWRKFGGAN
jgi:hypothetical protein